MSDTPWHIALHALRDAAATANLRDGDDPIRLTNLPARLTQFPVTFEEALERFMRLPRMFMEPDGALVWVSQDVGRAWQLDGVVYDGAGGVLYVELKGRCPPWALEQLASAVGWPEISIAVQLVPQGTWTTLEAFCRLFADDAPQDGA